MEYWEKQIDGGSKIFQVHCHSAMHSYTPETVAGFALTQAASLYVVFRCLMVRWIETLVVLAVSAAAPCFFFYYRLPDGSPIRYNQSWSMISIILVFPLTQSMTAAFQRRERGIQYLQAFKVNIISLLLAHRDWDWPSVNMKEPNEPPSGGRKSRLDPTHAQRVLGTLIPLLHDFSILLLAPTTSHVMTLFLAKEDLERVKRSSRNLRRQITLLFNDLSLHAEELKAAGMPANEATRIRQYFTAIIDSYNQLLSIKLYHTPLGLRAFTRIFILLMPWLFGPYLGNLAASTGIAFAITFSVVQSIALLTLFVIRFSLEDPFTPLNMPRGGHDAIDVSLELSELEEDLKLLVPPSIAPIGSPMGTQVTIELAVKKDDGDKR